MMKDFRIFGLSLMLLAGLGSCSDDDDPIVEEPVAVESVALDQTTVTLIEGETLQLKATVSPDDAEYDGISWSTSDAAIATVSDAGLVTAIAEGTVTVTAEAGGKTASCALTIEKAKGPEVEKVTLNQETATLKEGETLQLAATVSPEDADYSGIIWSTTDETIATVSEDGLVTAVLEGTVVITAQAGEQTAQCTITVERKPVLVSVEGDKAQIDLDAAHTPEEVATVINDAYTQGAVRFAFSGDFNMLGISATANDASAVSKLMAASRAAKGKESRTVVNPEGIVISNPFLANQLVNAVKEIDLSDVTNWPEVDIDGDMQPDGVKGLPAFAFFGRENVYLSLTDIILPSEVEALGTYSLSYYYLLHVEVPGVKTIGAYALNSAFLMTSFDGPNVTELKEGAFDTAMSLAEINLPNLTTIGANAFRYCYAFTTLSFPKVTHVGEEAFYYCSGLTNIDLPTAKEIGKKAFYFSPLTELSLPSATVIGVSFVRGENLQTLKLTAPGELTLMEEPTDDGKGYYTVFSGILSDDLPHITLYLNADKQDEVTDNTWEGRTWKEVLFE